jgi:CRISPR/Cas system-associated protein Cas5 (RAMP superfamily)
MNLPAGMRQLVVTIRYTESGKQEERRITLMETEYTKQFVVKVHVAELTQTVLFDREKNEILLPC